MSLWYLYKHQKRLGQSSVRRWCVRTFILAKAVARAASLANQIFEFATMTLRPANKKKHAGPKDVSILVLSFSDSTLRMKSGLLRSRLRVRWEVFFGSRWEEYLLFFHFIISYRFRIWAIRDLVSVALIWRGWKRERASLLTTCTINSSQKWPGISFLLSSTFVYAHGSKSALLTVTGVLRNISL